MIERQAHISQWITSGKSQKAYCAEHGITQSTFSWWRKQEKIKQEQNNTGFVPIRAEPSPRLEINLGEVQVRIYS